MAWQRYLAWSGLAHLREVVTLDTILCPTVPEELTPEDWRYNVHADYQTGYFRSLDYLRTRVAGERGIHILAIMREPSHDDTARGAPPGFEWLGYDVLDVCGDVSALTNCGGWDGLVVPSAVSSLGLLTELEQAVQLRRTLRLEHPGESHAECDIWAVWRLAEAT